MRQNDILAGVIEFEQMFKAVHGVDTIDFRRREIARGRTPQEASALLQSYVNDLENTLRESHEAEMAELAARNPFV